LRRQANLGECTGETKRILAPPNQPPADPRGIGNVVGPIEDRLEQILVGRSLPVTPLPCSHRQAGPPQLGVRSGVNRLRVDRVRAVVCEPGRRGWHVRTECAEARPFLYRERDRVRATWFESRAPIVGSSKGGNDPFVVRGAGKFPGRSGASSWNRGSGSGRPWSR